MPDVDGFSVFIQMEGGTFADPVKIGPPTDLGGIYGADGYRYDPWSQSRIHEMDYNQDGRRDLVFWNEDHFEVHLLGATGHCAGRGKHESRNMRESYPRAFNRTLLIGDVTGDGRSDVLIEWSHRELHVFAGLPGPDLFARRPQKVAVDVPADEEYTWLVDINDDAKQDILMHHPFTLRDAHGAPRRPPGSEPHRVALLIAR